MPTIVNPIFGEDEKTFCCQGIADSVPTNDFFNGKILCHTFCFVPLKIKDSNLKIGKSVSV